MQAMPRDRRSRSRARSVSTSRSASAAVGSGLLAERLGNLDQLLLPDAEPADGSFQRKFESDPAQDHAGLGVEFFPVDEQAVARLAAQKEVFRDGELGDEGKLLVDHGDAVALGVGDGVELCDAVSQPEITFIAAGGMEAGQQLDEG